jgi:hypothetical protein
MQSTEPIEPALGDDQQRACRRSRQMETFLAADPCNFRQCSYRKFNFRRYGLGMTVALRQQIRQQAFPNVSFGPFRFLEAMPWLVLAASMRVIGFNNLLIAIPAMVFASIAVLHAFLVVTQRSIELAQGQTSLGALTFREQSRLTRAILWRIVVLMIAAAMAVSLAGYTGFAPHLMAGLDGMAFDQTTGLGKFWSPLVAALVLLMVVAPSKTAGASISGKQSMSSRAEASGSARRSSPSAFFTSVLASARD